MKLKLTNPDLTLKIILLGDSSVGKSTFLLKYTTGIFNPNFNSTIGVAFHVKEIQFNNNFNVKLQIWDTAGQERFRAIVQSYYRGVNIIFLFFDLNNKYSFYNIDNWLEDIHSKININNNQILLIGTKSDLKTNTRINRDEIYEKVALYGMEYVEISSCYEIENKINDAIFNMTPLFYDKIHSKKETIFYNYNDNDNENENDIVNVNDGYPAKSNCFGSNRLNGSKCN